MVRHHATGTAPKPGIWLSLSTGRILRAVQLAARCPSARLADPGAVVEPYSLRGFYRRISRGRSYRRRHAYLSRTGGVIVRVVAACDYDLGRDFVRDLARSAGTVDSASAPAGRGPARGTALACDCPCRIAVRSSGTVHWRGQCGQYSCGLHPRRSDAALLRFYGASPRACVGDARRLAGCVCSGQHVVDCATTAAGQVLTTVYGLHRVLRRDHSLVESRRDAPRLHFVDPVCLFRASGRKCAGRGAHPHLRHSGRSGDWSAWLGHALTAAASDVADDAADRACHHGGLDGAIRAGVGIGSRGARFHARSSTQPAQIRHNCAPATCYRLRSCDSPAAMAVARAGERAHERAR